MYMLIVLIQARFSLGKFGFWLWPLFSLCGYKICDVRAFQCIACSTLLVTGKAAYSSYFYFVLTECWVENVLTYITMWLTWKVWLVNIYQNASKFLWTKSRFNAPWNNTKFCISTSRTLNGNQMKAYTYALWK